MVASCRAHWGDYILADGCFLFKHVRRATLEMTINNQTYKRIELLLQCAPIRVFKNFEARGYFAAELVKQFGVTETQVKTLMKKRYTFRWKLLTYDDRENYFFYLRS